MVQGTRLYRSVPVGTAVKCEPDDHGAGQPARGRLKGCRTESRRVDRSGGPHKGGRLVGFLGCRLYSKRDAPVKFYKANITRKVAKVEPVLSRAGRVSYTSK